jgi:ATP-dependent DNA helicase RecQ
MPVSNENGMIRIIRYCSTNLISPFVTDIIKNRSNGTTGVLVKTNEEAAQITGLLSASGTGARLIQSNEGFSLFNMYEVREFISLLKKREANLRISNESWSGALDEFSDRSKLGRNHSLCLNMFARFADEYPKHKYFNDFEIFVKESSLEDFFTQGADKITVSTMHKAKGREFDNVFILLDNYSIDSDEAKRLLYVAMTRAKHNLAIHYNGFYLDEISVNGQSNIFDPGLYSPPFELTMQLSHKDVWLDWFKHTQKNTDMLTCGDPLMPKDCSLYDINGNEILKFSKQFINQIEEKRQFGYVLKRASVMFIVYWFKEDAENEIKIVLPEVYFEKQE